METRRSKRQKAEVIQNEFSQDLSANAEANNFLVFDIVIRSIKCPQLLRKCRLVCKEWNISACAVLRQISEVNVDELNTKKIQAFHRLMKNRRLKLPEDFPVPFRRVYLLALNLIEKDFLDLAMEPQNELVPWGLCIVNAVSETSIGKVFSILKAQQEFLTIIKIESFKDFQMTESHKEFEGIKFPNLKKITIKTYEESLSSGSYLRFFVENVVRNSKLEVLELQFWVFDALRELLLNSRFEKVNSLRLEFSKNEAKTSEDIVRFFKSTFLPNLKVLTLGVCVDLNPVQISKIILSIAGSLEIFVTNCDPLSLDLFPTSPNLREIGCHKGYTGQCSPEKFPSLRKLYIWSPPPLSEVITPHDGVQQLCINIRASSNDSSHTESDACSFCAILANYGKNFNSMKHFLDKNKGKLCSAVKAVRTIQKSFPRLKNLSMTGLSDLNFALGFDRFLAEGQANELPIQSMVTSIFPITDFVELEKLHLADIEVNPAIIKYSLSRILGLKSLRIEQYKDLTAHVIRDNLGHLKEFIIRDCRRGDYWKLTKKHRLQIEKVKEPHIILYCKCLDCKNVFCQCEDCDQYGLTDQ